MASSPQSYQKRQRELRKKERKAEKQAIRHGKTAAKKEDDGSDAPDEDALLEEFRVLNESFAEGEVSQDDFDTARQRFFTPWVWVTHPNPEKVMKKL